MKFRFTIMCILLSLVIASSVCAQMIYYWKDEKGVMNATTTPPPENIKKFETDSYGKRDSPEEIQRYQTERKANEQKQEAETRQRQQMNRAQEEAQKQKNRQQSQPSTKTSGVGVGNYKVTVKRIGSNLYQDIYTRIIIKTSVCVELALMDEAILNWNGGSGELFFINSRTSCMVRNVYK